MLLPFIPPLLGPRGRVGGPAPPPILGRLDFILGRVEFGSKRLYLSVRLSPVRHHFPQDVFFGHAAPIFELYLWPKNLFFRVLLLSLQPKILLF